METRKIWTARALKVANAILISCLFGSAAQAQVVTDSANTVAQPQFTLPRIFPFPYVPTDQTGIGGSLGHAQGLRNRLLGPEARISPDSAVMVARDPRYVFDGQWTPVMPGLAQVATTGDIRTFSVVIAPQSAVLQDTGAARVMSGPKSDFTVNTANDIRLNSGALMVRGGADVPLTISTIMPNAEIAAVRIKNDALAMVSMLDGRLTVANFTESSRDSVMLYMTDRERAAQAGIPVNIGRIAELYPNSKRSTLSEMVAHSVLHQLPLSNGLTLESMRMSYPRAMKRFNITSALTQRDLDQVIKSAAAVAVVDGQAI